jgi:hypothetical protein
MTCPHDSLNGRLKPMSTSGAKHHSLIAGLVAMLITAGSALAYGTAGRPTTDTANAVTANQISVLAAMHPGDSPQMISGTFDNASSAPIWVNTVTASISSVIKAAYAPAGTCDATDFTLANATMTVDTLVPIGTNKGSWTGATIRFNDKPSNQDACKAATVNLNYAIA